MTESDAPVLLPLAEAFAALEREGWSDAQLRQIAMTRGQLERAVASGLLPEEAGRSLEGLLGGEGRRAFLELAEEGIFRRPDRSFRGPSTVQTANMLVLWTSRLAAAAGVGVEPVEYRYAAREPVGEQHLRMFTSYVASRVGAPGLSAYEVRFTAMAMVLLETGLGVGALGGLELDDLTPGRRRVRVCREPEEKVPLTAVAARAVRRWEGVRSDLVASLEGGAVRALWVKLRMSNGERAGLPLRAHDGIITTWAAGVSRVNGAMLGEPGWPGPMSPHIESLRRGVADRMVSSAA